MRSFILFLTLTLILVSCGSRNQSASKNPYANYFYEIDSVPKIYLFRDVANGLDEQFHRIYSVSDSKGDHVIVEIYSADGRILEALNYNVDSLDIMDHMVVNRNGEKTKAEVFKTKVIPMNATDEVWFASRFQGFLDSTLILKEIKRKISGKEIDHEVLGKKVSTIVMKDKIRLTNFNPFTKKENVLEGEAVNYFSEGYGLVEWHTPNKKVHFKLEKVMPQEEWVKIITR
ncbi:MAG: hypothetical protein ACK457_09190 [Flavobacteriia bacterium]|jgi:hypothetical protein